MEILRLRTSRCRLSRPGSLILAGNTIRGGSVLDPEDEATRGFDEALAKGPRLSALVLPLIERQGHYGNPGSCPTAG